ncbi:hypothetical protein, partial [Xanthomonas sp. SHU 166]|uniref:hypothetical protein n=1 Tax=Xanthomonas sp. SHU 166 TaxID=1591170 RepID=UPI001E315928
GHRQHSTDQIRHRTASTRVPSAIAAEARVPPPRKPPGEPARHLPDWRRTEPRDSRAWPRRRRAGGWQLL